MEMPQYKMGVFGWCWLTGEGCGARSGTTVSLTTV